MSATTKDNKYRATLERSTELSMLKSRSLADGASLSLYQFHLLTVIYKGSHEYGRAIARVPLEQFGRSSVHHEIRMRRHFGERIHRDALGCGLLVLLSVNQISGGCRCDGDLQWLAASFRAKMEGDRAFRLAVQPPWRQLCGATFNVRLLGRIAFLSKAYVECMPQPLVHFIAASTGVYNIPCSAFKQDRLFMLLMYPWFKSSMMMLTAMTAILPAGLLRLGR